MEREIILEIIDDSTQGVDVYHNNGSMWLIFTDSKKWVIELTKEGTLWYNYYFFKDCYKYLSLDVVENEHYVTEWVESIIQNGVRSTKGFWENNHLKVESIIQNGVKRTELGGKDRKIHEIKDIVENGIKETHEDVYHHNGRVEGVIKNGIKETNPHLLEIYNPMDFEPEIKEMKRMNEVNIVLENGIKETNWRKVDNFPDYVDRIIK